MFSEHLIFFDSIYNEGLIMKKILTNHQIPGAIIDLIEESEDYCFLVTPYFKPWNLLYRSLEKAANKEKKIIFIFRAENTISHEMAFLNEQFGFDVFFVDRLHTKLYFNGNTVIISSMNLYDSSKENNYELGYILTGRSYSRKFKDKIIDNDILSLEPAFVLKGRYLEALEQEQKEQIKKVSENNQKIPQEFEDKGYCIRCGTFINKNPYYPLCPKCYDTWSQFSNPFYTENYCHFCGEEAQTSKNQPICIDCENKYQ